MCDPSAQDVEAEGQKIKVTLRSVVGLRPLWLSKKAPSMKLVKGWGGTGAHHTPLLDRHAPWTPRTWTFLPSCPLQLFSSDVWSQFARLGGGVRPVPAAVGQPPHR